MNGKAPPRPQQFRHGNTSNVPQRGDEEVEARGNLQAGRDNDVPQRRNNNNRRGFKSPPGRTMLDQIPFSALTSLSYSVPEPEDLHFCGELVPYDRSYDGLTSKYARRLEHFENRCFFRVSTTDDPVIGRLAEEDKATVFATDAILSTLMCATRSVSSWKIVVSRDGNKLFLDKLDDSQLDYLSVHETSQQRLPEHKDDINSAHRLSKEATLINKSFSQQVLVKDGKKVAFDEPNPFASEGQEVASAGYRYRRWKLDDDMFLIARCELQGVLETSDNKRQFLTVNALNEFDPKYSGLDWRQKLDTHRGSILAIELMNNGNRIAKWTAQAMLASADMMKLGYVSRVHPRDNLNHVVLGVASYSPKAFAAQINLKETNMWGIVKRIVDLCMKLKEGKYLLVKEGRYLLVKDKNEGD